MRSALLLLLSAALMSGACSSKSESTTDNIKSPSASTSTSSVSYAEDATDITPVLTGTTIPNPAVRTVKGDSVQLMDLVSQKPTVLIFYRGGWCPYCSKHMAELQQAESKLVEMGYQLLAVSPDRPEKLKESIGEHDLSYTLLSDSPMKAASAFGLAFKVDQETLKRYNEVGIDLEASSGYDHHLLPVPAVYLVDTEGMIHFQYVNPDYQTRINSHVLLTAAEEYYPEEVES
ncbi:MAG: peroxiredoxin-like family protein [Balneolaceae bacterium]|nr:peroxiredoxin-like family protein [Balneolaceae bacterium]